MVKSFGRTLTILEELRRLDGADVSTLAESLEIPKSTIYNHVNTLEGHGYLIKDGSVYRIGLRFLELGEHARNQIPLYRMAQEQIQNLAEKTNESANLAVEEQGDAVCLIVEQGQQDVTLETPPGKRVDLHCSGMGKVILAHLPEARRNRLISQATLCRRTEHTITDEEKLRDELAEIRDQGYAFDDQEYHRGLRCIGAPILDEDDQVLGAVSISGPTSRMKKDRLEGELLDAIRDTINIIEVNITYSRASYDQPSLA